MATTEEGMNVNDDFEDVTIVDVDAADISYQDSFGTEDTIFELVVQEEDYQPLSKRGRGMVPYGGPPANYSYNSGRGFNGGGHGGFGRGMPGNRYRPNWGDENDEEMEGDQRGPQKFYGMNGQQPGQMYYGQPPQTYEINQENQGSAEQNSLNALSEIIPDDPNIETWVETKALDGKFYYYSARTRVTTWTKPEGENINLISQDEIDVLASAAKIDTIAPENGQMDANSIKSEPGPGPGPASGPALGHGHGHGHGPDPVPGPVSGPGGIPPLMGPGNMMMPPFNGPPFGQPPPFGMPPPGFPPAGFPGFQPPPWGFQPNMPPPMMPMPGMMGGMGMGMPPPMDSKIDPEILARAADWTEHKAPDGRPYYYNTKANESVWDKPQPLKDLDGARLRAQSTLVPGTCCELESADQNKKVDLAEEAKKAEETAAAAKLKQEQQALEYQQFQQRQQQQQQQFQQQRQLQQQQQQQQNMPPFMMKKADEKPKVVDKTKPVLSTPIPRTPWCVVWTGEGRVFFYNPAAKYSVWERPEELVGREDVTKLISTPPESVAANLGKKDATGKNDEKAAASDISPKKGGLDVTAGKGVEKRQIEVGKEAAIMAEQQASRERAVIPLETRINCFRELLVEKKVSAYSTWEKELSKIVFDNRYLLLTSAERKKVFDKYVKERIEDERLEKKNKMKQRREDYKALMSEANLHGKSSFNEFASKFQTDERFGNIEKMRERESLFNEYILEVRKREKDEKMQKREMVKKAFFELLKEQADIERHTRWGDVKKKLDSDARYKAVDSSSLREDWFRDYTRELRDSGKHEKEGKKDNNKKEHRRDKEHRNKDKEGKASSDSKKDADEKNASEDDGGEGGGGDTEKYKNAEKDNKDAAKDKEAEKQARMEASLREREKEVQRTLAIHLRDRDNEREQHKHDEAVHHFNALLADLVRSSDNSWREVKRQLRKDHRWELADLLSREEKEKLFESHVEQLSNRKRDKFRELLSEVVPMCSSTGWKEVKKLIKEDARYTKFSSSDRKCEKEFHNYMKDQSEKSKAEFKELLMETKLITHKSYATLKENEAYMKEIEDILKNDKRYLMLDSTPLERSHMIRQYMEELEKRGPPPPPTASDPIRRNLKLS